MVQGTWNENEKLVCQRRQDGSTAEKMLDHLHGFAESWIRREKDCI
jgi:hypothetical protein